MIHGGENSLKKKKRKKLLGILRANIPGGEMRPGGRRDLHSFPAHSSCRLPADPTHSPLLPAPHATLPGWWSGQDEDSKEKGGEDELFVEEQKMSIESSYC